MRSIKTFFSSWIGKVVIISFLFRIILAPFFFHPDLKIIFYISHYLPSGVFNIWNFLELNPDLNILGQFVYPPLTYFMFGIFYLLIKPFAGMDFSAWLGMGNTAVETALIFRYQFLTKLPIILFDVATVYLVFKFFKSEKLAKTAALAWAFNPFSIYSSTIIGQFDVIPAFLTLLAVYLAAKKQKLLTAAILIGLATSLKTYAILLLPALALTNSEKWTKKLQILLVGVATYGVTILPFIASSAFRESVLFSNLGQRIFSASINFGFKDGILIAPTIIILIYLYAWHKKLSTQFLPQIFAAIILTILSLSHVHPQWFTWAAPFLIVMFARNIKAWPLYAFLATLFIAYIIVFDDIFLNIGLFSPLNPGVYFLSSPAVYINKVYSVDSLRYIIHSGILATSILLIYSSLTSINDKK